MNKRWVTFVSSGDQPPSIQACLADTTGPADSKYCAEGGIYYVYNFVETGSNLGYVDYPWGVRRLLDFGNNLPVCSTLTQSKAFTKSTRW